MQEYLFESQTRQLAYAIDNGEGLLHHVGVHKIEIWELAQQYFPMQKYIAI